MKMIGDLRIQRAETGFVVYENNAADYHCGKMWAFETPEKLAAFVAEWADLDESPHADITSLDDAIMESK